MTTFLIYLIIYILIGCLIWYAIDMLVPAPYPQVKMILKALLLLVFVIYLLQQLPADGLRLP